MSFENAERVLVCGGRDYEDKDHVWDVLSAQHIHFPIDQIIHGDADGTDSLASEWATENDVFQRAFPADWESWGNRAGSMRNYQMLEEGAPDLIIAFPGGSGTSDMVKKGRAAGVRVIRAFPAN